MPASAPGSHDHSTRLPHDTSTIDHERLTRDIPRLLGGEKDRRRADVLRLLLASHRHDVGDTLLEHLPRRHALERRVGLRDVGGELLPEVGPQDAGADRVDGDPVWRQLLGHDAGERDHALLGHAVGRHRQRRERPRDGRDVDDPPRLALDEIRRNRLAREEDRFRVDRERAVPIFLGVVREWHAGRRPRTRVVDEDIDLPEPLARALDHHLDVRGARHVRLHRDDPAPDRLDLAGDLLCVQHLNVSDGDVGADRKSTRLNSSHGYISYAVFCLKKKKKLTYLATLIIQPVLKTKDTPLHPTSANVQSVQVTFTTLDYTMRYYYSFSVALCNDDL